MARVLQITTVIVFALMIFPAVVAQPVNKDKERAENERDLDLRSWNLRILSLQYNKNKSRRRPNPQQALEQLQREFSRLQAVNNNLVRTALSNTTLDPKFVSKSVSEIKKRAARLDKNLALPEPEKPLDQAELQDLAGSPQLKPSVLKLGRL